MWRYFAEFDRGLEHRAGMIDLLIEQAAFPHSSDVDWRQFTTKVRIGPESITLLTSGNLDQEYPARVLEFNWDNFFLKHRGGQFFERLRADWNREYDFVLVDSRTGITDIGGICTIVLPDLIVPVFVANNQNLDGIVDTLRRAQRGRQELAYDRVPALVLPVLSRFDSRTELESANEWLILASNRLGEFYADWLPRTVDPRVAIERTKLPYIPYFGFGEKLAVLLQGVTDPESLGYALNSVASLIDSNLKDVMAVMLGTDEPRTTSPDQAIRLEPSSDSWIATVHASDRVIGTAVVIDKKRLLTAESLMDQREFPLKVSFPKSPDKTVRRLRYSIYPIDGAEDGVVVLRLENGDIPPSVSAAPVRFPRAKDLVGRRWWTFGFPPESPLGDSLSGNVGTTLAFGSVRLNTESEYQLGPGFVGAPVWSPDYSAVVGIVTHVDGHGNFAASPLSEAADDLPQQRLGLLAEREPEFRLDTQQRKALIDVLANVFNDMAQATALIENTAIPRNRLRPFESFRSSRLYWENVVTALENGLIADGVRVLVMAARRQYPANPALHEIAESLQEVDSNKE